MTLCDTHLTEVGTAVCRVLLLILIYWILWYVVERLKLDAFDLTMTNYRWEQYWQRICRETIETT